MMKFSCQVDIDRPLDQVVELFNDPENLVEWQEGFISHERLNGEPGKVGSKSRFIYQISSQRIELIETILVNDLPHEFSGHYQSKATVNTMHNFFTALDDGKSRWVAKIEYTELKGFMVKLMTFFFPGLFKRQTQQWLDRFKAFAEKQD